jgi:hypothetical protein
LTFENFCPTALPATGAAVDGLKRKYEELKAKRAAKQLKPQLPPPPLQ